MRFAVLALGLAMMPSNATAQERKEMLLVDFSDPGAVPWVIVNDGVMGGRSTSDLEVSPDGTGLFTGRLSLENNGGFASTRAAFRSMDLSSYEGVMVRARGDGRTYQLRFRTDGAFDGLAYRAEFETTPGEWIDVSIPFERFEPSLRGWTPPDAGPLDPARIRQMGFLLGDKKEGPFRLEIAWVKAY